MGRLSRRFRFNIPRDLALALWVKLQVGWASPACSVRKRIALVGSGAAKKCSSSCFADALLRRTGELGEEVADALVAHAPGVSEFTRAGGEGDLSF